MRDENAAWLKERLALWNEVGRGRLIRAQVLARRGRPHPDPAVDALAVRWAQKVLASPPWHPDLQGRRTLVIKAAAIQTITARADSDHETALMDRTDRRNARRILQAHGLALPDEAH